MKTIKLYDRRRYDRVIGLLEEDGKVVQMNFMQGDFKGASDMLTDVFTDGTTDEKLMCIFRQMTKGRDAHDVDLLDLICETFCDSYVFSDVNQFTTDVKEFYRNVFDRVTHIFYLIT